MNLITTVYRENNLFELEFIFTVLIIMLNIRNTNINYCWE
jgi:hypothetical protein